MAALNSLVSEAVDLVVHAERGPDGPRVMSILAVEDLTAGPEAVHFTTTELFSRARHDAPLEPTGQMPLRAARRLNQVTADLRSLLVDPVAAS